MSETMSNLETLGETPQNKSKSVGESISSAQTLTNETTTGTTPNSQSLNLNEDGDSQNGTETKQDTPIGNQEPKIPSKNSSPPNQPQTMNSPTLGARSMAGTPMTGTPFAPHPFFGPNIPNLQMPPQLLQLQTKMAQQQKVYWEQLREVSQLRETQKKITGVDPLMVNDQHSFLFNSQPVNTRTMRSAVPVPVKEKKPKSPKPKANPTEKKLKPLLNVDKGLAGPNVVAKFIQRMSKEKKPETFPVYLDILLSTKDSDCLKK